MNLRSLGTVLFALCLAATPAQALTEIATVDPARGKAMGITVTSRANGDAGTRVTVTFSNTGALSDFVRAQFRLENDGEHVVSATLLPKDEEGGKTSVSFSVAPGSLEGASVWLYVGAPLLGSTAYAVDVAAFLQSP